MKKLDELNVEEILKKIDFSEEFINKFKDWCKDNNRIRKENSTMDKLIYSNNSIFRKGHIE